MSQKKIKIDFGVLGIGILHSPDGQISLESEEVASALHLPEDSSLLLIEQKIARLNEAEKITLQHRLLQRARAVYQESIRRGKR